MRHRVCALSEIEPGTARQVDVGGHRLALIRVGDDVYALGDRCTHEDVSLSEGAVNVDDRELECWKHGSSFSLDTGEPRCLPATDPTPIYDVDVRDGVVFVEIDQP